MRSHRGASHRGPSSFSADVFFRSPRLASRHRPPPPSPLSPKSRADEARDVVAYNTDRLGSRRGLSYGHGLKLFSLFGRFVRVCKTVAKLLAGSFFSDSTEIHCPRRILQYQTTCSLLSLIRYAVHATIPARNRESGFPSRPPPRKSLSCVDRLADNADGGEVSGQVIRMEQNDAGIPRGKKDARNQSNRFFFALFIRTRRNKETAFPTRSERNEKFP